MNQPETIANGQIAEVLTDAVADNAVAIMTHLSRGKWHMTKVSLTSVDNGTMQVDIVPREKKHPINIQIDQPVGISVKLGYNKYIFDTVVRGFEPGVNSSSGGTVIMALPETMARVQRRSYFRVPVPKCYNVNVLFWHRGYHDGSSEVPFENYWQAHLVDISAGGMQISIESNLKENFRVGQLVGLQFTPLPHERPMLLEAQVRHMAPKVDGERVFLGLQIIGLEASMEGREVLARLCGIVEYYHQINQCSNSSVHAGMR